MMNEKSKLRQLSFLLVFSLLITLLTSPPAAFSKAAQKLPVVRIGMVMDGYNEEILELNKLFIKEIQELLAGEFDVRFPEDKTILSDWKPGRVKASVDALLDDTKVDIVLALGFMSSNEVCTRGPLPKPVVAPFTFDVKAQGLPFRSGTSGVRNLNYLTTVSNVFLEIYKFWEIVDFEKMAVLFNHCPCTLVPEMCRRIESSIEEYGIEVVKVHAEASPEQALADIPEDVEAVYIAPLDQFLREDFDRIVQGLIDRKLPSFSHLGRRDVEKGVLAGMATEVDFQRLARRVALNVQRILLGEDAGTLPVNFTRGERLTLNMATARAIGFRPTWDVLGVAELINEEPEDIARKHTLKEVLEEAVRSNLDLRINALDVAAGLQEVRLARANLLPTLEVGLDGVMIDRDRAEGTFSMMAQRTLTGSAGLTQVVYSEPAWANLSIQKYMQQSREYQLQSKGLDIMLEAAVAYFNVLRAKTYQKIQADNLKLTQSNLELARIRLAIGVSGPAELYRWESQIATITKDRIDADARRMVAEIALNRLLHRPLEEKFALEDRGLDIPGGFITETRFDPYLNDPWSFRVFRDFMAREGLAASPELRTVDAAIEAQKRALASAKHSFWAPTVGLQAEASHLFAEGGAGSEEDPLGSLITDIVGEPDDTDLSIGLGLSLPLFRGGARISELGKAKTELARLYTEREALAEMVEQRIRSALHNVGSSWAGMELTQAAAETAHKNLDLVRDSYSRGVVSIIDLLDAQNASFVADLVAADAVYDCLLDYMEVQRSTSVFHFMLTQEEREAIIERVVAYFGEVDAESARSK